MTNSNTPEVIHRLARPVDDEFEEEVNTPPIVHDATTVFSLMVTMGSLAFFQQFPAKTRALLCREMR